MSITALPTPPTRSDPANFRTRADAFLSALPTFATEANALAVEVNGYATAAAASQSAAAGSASTATTQASNAAASATLAQDWATKTDGPVSGMDYSAKYNAGLAAASAASALNAPGTIASSTTSNSIPSVGQSRTFTIQTGKAYSPGQTMAVAAVGAVQNNFTGVITAHDSMTGSITIEAQVSNGSGTFANWYLALGALANGSIQDTNTDAEFYLLFASGSGAQTYRTDTVTDKTTYNPELGRLTSNELVASEKLQAPNDNAPAGTVGALRRNSTTGEFEGYGAEWMPFGSNSAVAYPGLSADKTLIYSDMGYVSISFTAAGFVVKLPNATTVAKTKASVVVKNTGAFAFLLQDFIGRPLAFVPAYTSITAVTLSTATPEGVWLTPATINRNFDGADTAVTGLGSITRSQIIGIGGDKYLAAYRTSGGSGISRVLTLDPKTGGISLGAEFTFHSAGLAIDYIELAFAGTDKVVAIYTTNTTANFLGRVLSVSGTTITGGTVATLDVTGTQFYPGQCCNLATDKVLVAYNMYDGANAHARAIALSISGTTITAGTAVSLVATGSNQAPGSSVVKLATDKALSLYLSGSALIARVLTISGTTITPQASITADATAAGLTRSRSALVSTDKVFARYQNEMLVLTVSGNATTAGTPVSFSGSSTFSLATVDTDKVIAFELPATSLLVYDISITGTVPAATRDPVTIETGTSGDTGAAPLSGGYGALVIAGPTPEATMVYRTYLE